jgi:hypothetical protein
MLQCVLFIFPSDEKWFSLEWLEAARESPRGADLVGRRISLRAGIRYSEYCRMLPDERHRT